jgi:hypothetical protein
MAWRVVHHIDVPPTEEEVAEVREVGAGVSVSVAVEVVRMTKVLVIAVMRIGIWLPMGIPRARMARGKPLYHFQMCPSMFWLISTATLVTALPPPLFFRNSKSTAN